MKWAIIFDYVVSQFVGWSIGLMCGALFSGWVFTDMAKSVFVEFETNYDCVKRVD